MIKRSLLFFVFVVLLGGGNSFAAALPVCVSILPQKFFVERIGGDLVDVSVMVMPGASPATYEPSPRQMVGLSKAKAYFSIGVPFENGWLDRISGTNPSMVLIKTDQGVTKIPMEARHHGHAGHEHEGGTPDPHIWLSPVLAEVIADNICEGLIDVDPENAKVYEANRDALRAELTSLDTEIRQKLASVPDAKRTFMVFHPSWGYFAHEYGLHQVAIEVEGKSPSPRELAEIVEHGHDLGVSVVFVQPQFSSRSAQVIAAEINAEVTPLDPLAEDWAKNLLRAAEAFKRALR